MVVAGTASAQTKPKAPVDKVIPQAANGRTREEIIFDNKLKAEKFFSKAEMDSLKVLVDIIIPADATSGSATQAGVPDFIEFIVKDIPSHQTPMRGGLMWVDNMAIKMFKVKFTALSADQRIQIVDLIAYPEKAQPEHSQGVAFFNLLRNLTATGFFTSEMGLKDLGYAGNQANKWDGVPDDVLAKYNVNYNEWEKHLEK